MPKIIVAKFGGSSLSNAQTFKNAKRLAKVNNCNIIVVSALGVDAKHKTKITDQLHSLYYSKKPQKAKIANTICRRYLAICKNLKIKNTKKIIYQTKRQLLTSQSLDFVLSRGEYLSSYIFAKYIKFPFVDARDLIKFDQKALDAQKTLDNIKKVTISFVVGGFYGSDNNFEIATFSRGGSDLTAALIANAKDAACLIKFTDTDGIIKDVAFTLQTALATNKQQKQSTYNKQSNSNLKQNLTFNKTEQPYISTQHKKIIQQEQSADTKLKKTTLKGNKQKNNPSMQFKPQNKQNISENKINCANFKSFKRISYSQLQKLCKINKNIMHPQSIAYLIEKNIPLKIINSFNFMDKGTIILG